MLEFLSEPPREITALPGLFGGARGLRIRFSMLRVVLLATVVAFFVIFILVTPGGLAQDLVFKGSNYLIIPVGKPALILFFPVDHDAEFQMILVWSVHFFCSSNCKSR